MISLSTAGLAISIARGVMKLGGRIDRLMAEKEATTGELVLPMPSIPTGLSVIRKAHELEAFLESTKDEQPDPLGDDRDDIEKVLVDRITVTTTGDAKIISDKIEHYFEIYMPEKALEGVISPDSEYMKRLGQFYPTLNLDDPETRMAAFYIRAGKDNRTIGYAGRMALLVVDVVAEFGAENTSLFIRDLKVQTVVKAVLTRFSEPELEDYEDWSPLVRHALGATLNGVLDAREAYQGDDRWLGVVLNALNEARKEGGDDYLLDLFKGQGFQLLLSTTLSSAAAELGEEGASQFGEIAADVLKAAAPLVKENKGNFADFFSDHWGDLLNAGLVSLEKHGPSLLEGKSPLLKETLLAVIKLLAATDGKELFTSETLIGIVDAAIGAVAAKPELLTADVDQPWLRALLESVITTASDLKIKNTFTKGGLERIIKDATAKFGEHPELIVEDNEIFQKVVGRVLKSISGVDRITAETIANAAIAGTLNGIAANPALLKTEYAAVIASFAGKLSTLITEKKIKKIQAEDIVTAATKAMLENPILFNKLGDKLTEAIVDAVVNASGGDDERLILSLVQIDIIQELFSVVAKSGSDLIKDDNLDQLKAKLQEVVEASLTRAAKSIGRGMKLPTLPSIIGSVVDAVAKGDVTTISADNETFIALFNKLMNKINTQAIA